MVPIKDKTGKTLVIAFKSVLKSGRSPKSLQTDKGTEFKNKEFQNFLKTKKIHFFTTEKPQVSENLYGESNSKKAKPKFKVGDFVRINKTKRTFDKGYLPNWTQELFQILAVVKTQTPITYKIKDLEGELDKGTFYSHELQRVEKDQIYEIDSVLDHRKRKVGKKWVKEIKVH